MATERGSELYEEVLAAIAGIRSINGLEEAVGEFTPEEKAKLESARQEIEKDGLPGAAGVLGEDFVQRITHKIALLQVVSCMVEGVSGGGLDVKQMRKDITEVRKLRQEVEALPAKEKAVVENLYGLANGRPKTAIQTAVYLGISVTKVNRIEARVMAKLRRRAEKAAKPV